MRNVAIRHAVIFAAVVASVGCGSSSLRGSARNGSIADVVRASDYGLEVEATTQDQAREEILTTPTSFDIQFDQDEHCWERARFFLENYTGAPATHSSVVTRVVGVRWSLASNPAESAYLYEVAKDSTQDGYTYYVTCQPGQGGSSDQAALNAGNLARFIREGKLEMSLLRESR